MVWEVLVGSIPEGYDLHHRCGNHGCVNPEHLEARPPRAHRGPKPKLDDQTLNTVLAMVLEGYTLADIAAELDVDYTTISTIRLGALFRRL